MSGFQAIPIALWKMIVRVDDQVIEREYLKPHQLCVSGIVPAYKYYTEKKKKAVIEMIDPMGRLLFSTET